VRECLCGRSPRSILFPFRNSREDHQWPGQPRLSLKSASASRSTVICRPSSDLAPVASLLNGATNHRSCSARRREEAFLNGIVAARHAFWHGRRRGCGRAGEPRRIERFWLRSISRGNRLLAASGFKNVSVTGVLTYPRKQAGRKCCPTAPLRCDTLPEVFPSNGYRPAARAVLVRRSPAALSQGGFRCAISCSRLAWAP
jgi:hypothetical protein